ncbi:hypothetical protein HK105_206939 [Polyrhizophydium stewartii]|uniref:Uncharacterized protein n=1 Tax=Polyrhizophydium stewartii TaxID=2732419 RepID=A0ABR4N1U5_9FUNG
MMVYVLPTAGGRFALHPRLLIPKDSVQFGVFFASFVLRKWRYQVSDQFGSAWHGFGRAAAASGSPLLRRIYATGNRLTTRVAADEYFLKAVSALVTSIEFVYPPSIDDAQLRKQVGEWLKRGTIHRNRTFAATSLLPLNFVLAKFFLMPANAVLVYHLFRLSSSMRAHTGVTTIQKLVDRGQVKWTPSAEFEEQIRKAADAATAEMAEMRGVPVTDPSVWKWRPGADIHDLALDKLQREISAPELLVNYRRARMQYFVYPNSV